MAKEHLRPVDTPIGTLHGRDAVYLDDLHDRGLGTLTLAGEFNSKLASRPPAREWVHYSITFVNTLAYTVIERDSWEDMHPGEEAVLESSFDEVVHSRWLAALDGKLTREYRHYRFAAYDYIVDIACTGHEITVETESEDAL